MLFYFGEGGEGMYDLDSGIMHPKFDPTRVRTYDIRDNTFHVHDPFTLTTEPPGNPASYCWVDWVSMEW